jgi:hypothetical protein
MGAYSPQYERGNKKMQDCLKCEKFNTCTLVDSTKCMKYFLLGKITYSNKPEYIGSFLEISEINYIRLKQFMDKRIVDHNFENHLNDFSYHLIEEDIEPNINIEKGNVFGSKEIIPKKMLTTKIFNLHVFYTLNEKFGFPLFYNSDYPNQLPIRLFIKEIFDKNYNENGGNDNV